MSDSNICEYNAPFITAHEVKEHLQTFYNLQVRKIKQLVGYDSANFYIEDTNGRPILFKVISCTSPKEIEEFLHHQIDLMKTVARDLPEGLVQEIIEPLPEKSETSVISIRVRCKKNPEWVSDNCFHKAVVIKYVPGEVLTIFVPFSNKLLESVGEKFGLLSKCLQETKNEVVWRRKSSKWDPKNVLDCESSLRVLSNVSLERRKMCENFFERYSKKTLPFIESCCRPGIIHSDGNPNNILVRPEA